jgi:outer membrane protein assembly factor BamB
MSRLTTYGLLSLIMIAGCGGERASLAQPPSEERVEVSEPKQRPVRPSAAVEQAQGSPADSAIPNLWTRTKGEDWPTFLGPRGDGKSSETGILTHWPKEGLRIVWQKELGTGYGIGSISRGRLFQFDRFGDVARLYALNAETGEELWRCDLPTEYEDLYGYNNGPRCSPVVDGDRVYVYGVDGVLACVNAADGSLVWKVDANKRFGVIQNFFGVGSTPVIHGDLLIAMVGGSPPEDQNTPPGALDRVSGNGSGVVAFDKRTGKVVYQITDELASYASLKTATIDGRPWCFAFCRGGLVGFNPANGKVDFEFPWRDKSLESVNASMPVVVDDEVFISETYGPGSALLEVSPGNHRVVWQDNPRKRDKAMQTHWNTPVYHEGYLYGCSGRHTENAELRCIEWKTGKVMWSEPGLTRTSLTFIDGHFLCLGEYGSLSLFKATPEKFEPVAECTLTRPTAGPAAGEFPSRRSLLKYPCWAAPVVSHGLLYVRGDDRLVCLELIPQ